YNAQVGLGIAERCGRKNFEERVLEKVGLKAAPISTQILPPEPLAFFLYACCMFSASLAQFGRDGRNLMRTEIAEISEAFEAGQVGSSTMAHKRNPINFENTEGQWIRNKNEFGKVQDALISEHQRDLVGSSVMRDFPIILINTQYQLNTLRRKGADGAPFLRRLSVDPDRCRENIGRSTYVVLAEPLYIALQMAGYKGDAHELVNRTLVPAAQANQRQLIDELVCASEHDSDVRHALDNIPKAVYELLHHPTRYTGNAALKTLEVADAADEFISAA
ncbi:MAG: lyase family protein, partial [Patescibacteria group bacterium]|nr:lyase family protein [Patescibacteria group bacterium]